MLMGFVLELGKYLIQLENFGMHYHNYGCSL